MYPGLGIFCLMILCLADAIIKRSRSKRGGINGDGIHRSGVLLPVSNKSILPLIILSVLYTLFAITNVVSLNDKVLFTVPIPKFIRSIGEIFRASGRFFWLPYYLLLTLLFVSISRAAINYWLKAALFVCILLIQFYDIRPLLSSRQMTYGAYRVPLDNRFEKLITASAGVTMYPPFEASYASSLDYQDFCFLAANAKKPINTGYVARLDNKAMKLYRDSLDNALSSAELDPNVLYITDSAHLRHFTLAIESHSADIGSAGSYFFIVAKQSSRFKPINALFTADTGAYTRASKIIGSKTLFRAAAFPDTAVRSKINYNVEGVISKGKAVIVNGWAFLDSTTDNTGDSIFLSLMSEQYSYIAPAQRFLRPDLTQHFKKKFLDNAGFSSILFSDSVARGVYKLGIIIKDKDGNTFYQDAGAKVNVGQEAANLPLKVDKLPAEMNILVGIDLFKEDALKVSIGGWAAFDGQSYLESVTTLVMTGESGSYLLAVEPVLRPDVTRSRSGKLNLDSSGFNVSIVKKSLPPGEYRLGIMIDDKKQNKKGIVFFNKSINTKSP